MQDSKPIKSDLDLHFETFYKFVKDRVESLEKENKELNLKVQSLENQRSEMQSERDKAILEMDKAVIAMQKLEQEKSMQRTSLYLQLDDLQAELNR